MAERSPRGGSRSRRAVHATPRGRLIVGFVLLAIVAAGVAFALSKMRSEPGPGRLLYAARQGVFVRDLATGDDELLRELPDDVEIASPSPDGRWVAYARGEGAVWLASLTDDRRFEVAQRFTVPLGWSPDNRLLAGELLSDRDLVAIDPDGKREILLSGGYNTGTSPVWIDADRFAIATGEDRFKIVDGTQTGESIDGLPLAASPDGAELLIARKDRVFAARVAGDAVSDERELFRGEASTAAASPQGFVALAARDDEGRDGVYVFEGGTRSRRVIDRAVDWVGWTRAGGALLYSHEGAGYALELGADARPKRVTRERADVFPVLSFAVVE